PARAEERRGVARMGTRFDAALKKPPEGVQVVTACVAGEYSYELELSKEERGGVMLAQVARLERNGDLKGLNQRPEDSIPLGIVSNALRVRTETAARGFLKAPQTVRLTGSEAESPLAYDVKYRPAPKFEINLAGAFEKGIAT